jgi:DNA-binding NtrC family response regulator
MEGLKVLLVDDEVEFVSTLAERLRIRGIEADTANSGIEALDRIAATTPHVVVLDVMMPGMSGIEVLRQIKKVHPNIPVILLTGIGSTGEATEGMRQGAFDYLMKPLQLDKLLEKIEQAVNKTRGGVS